MSSLARALQPAILNAKKCYRSGTRVTLATLMEPLGSHSSALGAALLALPFLNPISMGPVTTAASVVILYLGWRLFRGHEDLPLPAKYLSVPMPQAVFKVMRRVTCWLGARRHRKPWFRVHFLPDGATHRIAGAGVLVGTVLLAVPVPLLPLTNTFPALAIILFAQYALQKNDTYILTGTLSLLVSVLLFAAIGVAFILLGDEALHIIMGWLGLAQGTAGGART